VEGNVWVKGFGDWPGFVHVTVKVPVGGPGVPSGGCANATPGSAPTIKEAHNSTPNTLFLI
jgi:hypothetical protein